MTWSRLYRLRSYLRSSLWVVPFIAIPLEIVIARLVHRLDLWLDWQLLGYGMQGAQAILQAIISSTLAFVVFTFGSILVAIQVASGQLTPRIIATTLLRDNVVKYTVGLFIFTLLFAISALDRMGTTVHQLVMFVAALLGVSCFLAFLYLIDYAARLLRPISILAHVARQGLAVIDAVYPDPSVGPKDNRGPSLDGVPGRVMHHEGTSEIVLGIQVSALAASAERSKGIIEFVPRVGDFVAVDEPLFNLYEGATAIEDRMLRAAVAFGPERTMEQDPTFAFRIVIDIALKALSPAINDPTTAVLAIDQLHRLLRAAGRRNLRTDEILDKSGHVRVILRTPNWEDFVSLAFSEIRQCGSDNLQIVRRLRSMIDNLVQTLPQHRHQALRQELSMLDRDIGKHFSYPEELALARVADSQGLGGHSGLIHQS